MAIPLRVLIIEDSDNDAALDVRELERAGYKITHEIVSTAKKMKTVLHTQTFDLIISDHNLPQFDSLKALAILKESGLDIPFIVVSGTIGEETAVKAMKAGAHDYVMKGNLSRLGTAVERELRDVEVRRKHKQAEDALRESEERFKTIIDNASDGILLTDLEAQRFYIANRAICQMLGYNLEEIRNLGVTDIHPEKDLPYVLGQFERQSRGEITLSGDIPVKRKDGSVFYADVNTSTMAFGGKTYLAGIFRDTTERKKMQEQLIIQDRLASIGQLASGIAHEMNNPLTGIIGFSELLMKRTDLPDDAKEDLKIVNNEAKRTANVVKGLLTFARKQKAEKEPVDINSIIQNVLQLRSYEHKVSNIEVSTHLAPELPQVLGNSGRLQQVFINLIANAEQAMLEAHNRGTFTIVTERVGDIIKASIADDGPGISEENMSKLFTPFFTTKEVGKGTGLGLSICHGIVTEHDGNIYAESESGKGATFVVELPIKK